MLTMLYRRFAAALVLALATMPATSAQQQQQQQQPQRPTEFESWTVPGWTFTPSVSIGGLWDSNVAVAGNQAEGRGTERGRLFVFEPQGQLEFRNNRTDFVGGYKGYVRRYFDTEQLNGFDQRLFLSLQRLATKRVTVFARNEFADVPSTDEVLLNGIPYSRTGSKSNRFATGVEMRLTKYDDLTFRYENTWVSFDNQSTFLRGGLMNEARVDYGRRLSERTTVGGEYRVRQAELNDGAQVMWFHDFGGTVQYALGPHVSVTAAGGYSVLRDPRVTDQEGGAYVRGELTRRAERATSGVYYERSFAPSFGFGGSSESQELRGYVHMPFSRNRFYLQSSAGWRQTNPLALLDELDLDTFLIDNTVGYGATRWLRLEVFHVYTRQDSRITGGEINRHRAGAQVVISQPMRIR